MFVGLGVVGVVPVCHGLIIYGYHSLNERMGLNWVLLEGGLYIFGAFLYAVSKKPNVPRINVGMDVDKIERYVGLNEHHQEPSTSGATHTNSFISSSCSLRQLTSRAWRTPLISTIVS